MMEIDPPPAKEGPVAEPVDNKEPAPVKAEPKEVASPSPASAPADTSQQAVTRCPCGENDDTEGFMIACEQCEVWQHGECVGVTEDTVPEQYFCEDCKPDHAIHKRRKLLEAQLKRKRGPKSSPTPAAAKEAAERKQGSKKGSNKRKRPVPTPKKADEPMDETDAASLEEDNRKRARTSDDSEHLSREQRKFRSLLQTIDKLERTQTGPNATPAGPTAATPELTATTPVKVDASAAAGAPKDKSKQRVQIVSATSHAQQSDDSRRKRTNGKAVSMEESPTHDDDASVASSPTLHNAHRRMPCLTPMYMGRSAWLMKMFREEQQRKTQHDFPSLGMDTLPVQKRCLMAFRSHNGEHKLSTSSSSSSSAASPHSAASNDSLYNGASPPNSALSNPASGPPKAHVHMNGFSSSRYDPHSHDIKSDAGSPSTSNASGATADAASAAMIVT